MSKPSTRSSCQINAPREAVYRALLNSQAVSQWMVPRGMTSHVHEFDARVGGMFRISLTYDSPTAAGKTTDHTDTYHGRFVELEPSERVVEAIEFETDNPAMQGEMILTYHLADSTGGTQLTALHENLPPGVSPADNEYGWRMSLQKLAEFVEDAERH